MPMVKLMSLDCENLFLHFLSVSVSVTFHLTTDVKWIKVNAEQRGYYRVLYNEDNWQSIIEELKRDHGTFSAVVRPNEFNINR